MDSETAINKADILLREVPNVKATNTQAVIPKNPVKEELQFLRIPDNIQEEILDTLKFIHGDDFKIKDASEYANSKSNLLKKYWVGQGSLVVKGGCDYSQYREDSKSEEYDRLRQFALMRLQSYGFHQNHCLEAFEYCNGDVEESLELLYSKYFNVGDDNEKVEHFVTKTEQAEFKSEEKSSLESIYESTFKEKLENVWILTLQLDYLVNMFHNKEKKVVTVINKKTKDKEKCKNFIRGHCKFGNNCRFSHVVEEVIKPTNSHLEDYSFELEFRFPKETKYPYEAPLIFLKTNAVLPPLVNLHICKKLYKEAKLLASDGTPCIYSVTELLLNNPDEIKEHLKTDVDFLHPNQKLFTNNADLNIRKKRPSHYKKGITNRDNKKQISIEKIKETDQKIVENFSNKIKESRYKDMLFSRKKLPAWNLKKDILNFLQQSQVIVVSGETGCGKSTQVPQYILDEWISSYNENQKHIEIVCTQPRRISAIGVAERVADERLEKIGNTVGYQIRLESKISSYTRLSFCTTGILLRRLESEPMLQNVTHIIVDEVHERSEESDFLLLILKELLVVRPDLKVILMSATLNANLFSNYFGDIPIVNIPGRTFPVDQIFLEDVLEKTNYVLEEGSEYCKKIKNNMDDIESILATNEISYAAKPRDNIKDENLTIPQIMARYQDYSAKTCRNLFLMDTERINNELIECILNYIIDGSHDFPKKGTILIFVPGIAEITSLYDQLIDHRIFGKRAGRFLILPLHSSLTSEEQAAIFRKPKDGQRKIVLSTNLAETSVTIDDCVFVIDSGRMKEKHFDPNRNMESLETVWVTRANALQRKGRAGRVMPGICFHLYTSHRFSHHMLPQPIPEIHRVPLEQLILDIKVLPNFDEREVEQVLKSFIEPPSDENILTAIKRLQDVGAFDKENNLTPLGHHLAALPVDVRIGKLMLFGAIFGCIDSALTMAACLSYKNPFVTPFGKRDEANKKKMQFSAGYSDHITVLMAYKKFLATNKKNPFGGRNFANENYLSYKTLITLADIKHQFLELLVDIGFISVNLTGRRRTGVDNVFEITGSEFNRNSENFRLLSSILCAALYPNIIKILTPSKSYVMSAAGAVPKENDAKDLKFSTKHETVFLHPGSVNYTVRSFPSPYLVYQEKVKTSKVFFRDCTMIPIIPLALFSGNLDIVVQNGNSFISIEDGWILFQVEEHKVAEMIKLIRDELLDLLEEKIKDPLLNLLHNERGERIVSLMLKLISL